MKKIKQAVAVILCVTMLSSVLMLAPVTACAAETSQKESTAFESNVSFHAEEAPEAAPEETETTESQPETALPAKECIGEAVGAEASEPAQENGFTFVTAEGCAVITAYERDVSITRLVIPNQLGGCPVTTIGQSVFSGVDYLQEIVIPDSVTEIGGSSFEGCTGLNSIQLPSKLEKLGPLAFKGCTGLTEITLPKTLTTVGIDWNYTSPFFACDHLKKVVFEAGTTAVQNYICKDLTCLEEVVIPDSVTVIGANAFTNCVSLTQSDLIPDSVTEIGGGSFEGCTELNRIQLPSKLEKLGSLAFKGCTGLTEIFLPKTLTTFEIDWHYTSPFVACDHLKKVVFEAGTTAVQNYSCKDLTSLEEVVIPDSVTVIGANAFTNCVSLTQSDLIPDGVTEIGGSSFEGCTGLNSIQLPSGLEKIGTLAFKGCTGLTEIFLPKTLTTVETDWRYTSPFAVCENLKKVVFEAGTTAVQNCICKDLTSLEEVVIPDSVTVIGGSAFANCSSLAQSDLIPVGVTEIGGSSFEGCTALNHIQLPSGLEKIGTMAFNGCTGLTEILLPKTLTTVETDWRNASPFAACENLKKVVFEAGTTAVQNNICKDLTSLEEVVIPDSVTVIGANAFTNCSSLAQRDLIPDSVTVIGNYAFTNCVSLTQNDLIPDSVTEIGWSAFEGCTGLNRIQLPSGLEKLGPLAFKGCTGLTEITLPKTLTTVDTAWYDTSPFVECNRLKKVVFEAGTTAVPACICKDLTSLENAVIPDGVTSIGQHAFKNSSVLLYSDFKLPDSIERVEAEAFNEEEIVLSLPDNIRYAASNAFDCNVIVRNGSRTAVTLINSGIRVSFSSHQRPEMPVLNLQESHMNLTSVVASTTRIHCTYSVKSDEFDRLSDMYIQFYIPEFAELTPNSLYLNKEKITDYRIDNERLLTVPVTEKTGKITFQIDALDLSEEEANDKNLKIFAILGYTKDGKKDYDVIDTIVNSYNTLTLTAPEEFSESFVTVSGFAPAGRIVTICIDEMDRVQLQANKAGRYSGSVSLHDYEMEDGKGVTLQAVIRESNGKTLNAYTSTKFRKRTPKLTEFTMLYNGKTYDLLADTKYNVTFLLETFHGAQPFEFHVKYTEADVIESVDVTSTRNGVKDSMKAVYDPEKGMYVAKGYFVEQDHDYVPGTIGVEFKRPTPEKPLVVISEEMDKLSRSQFLKGAEIDAVVNQDSHKVFNATFVDSGSLQYVFDTFTALEFIKEYLETYPEEAEPIIRHYLGTHPVESAKSHSEAVGAPASEFVGGFVGLIDSLREYPDTNLTELVIEFFDAAPESRAIYENTGIYVKKTKDPNGKISIWRVEIGETNVNGLYREVIMPETADLYEKIITNMIKASKEEDAEVLADAFSDMFAVDQFALDLSGSAIDFLEDLYGEGIKLSYTEFTDEDVRKFTDHVKESLENLTCEIIGSAFEAVGGVLVGECPPLGLACWAIGHFIGNDYKDNRELFNSMFKKFDNVFTQINDKVRSFFKNVFSFTIDPSGYVYAAVTDNRVAGATVTAYWIPFDEDDENYWSQPDEARAVVWDSNEYSQLNPDETDALGNYAWDVPEGWWRVVVEKEGYETYTTEWLPVPPPQIDVNINLMSKAVPEIAGIDITESAVVLAFSEYVDPDTLDTLTLTDEQGDHVPFALTYDRNSTDLSGKVSVNEVSLVFDESYIRTKDSYTVTVNDAASYAGVRFSATASVRLIIGDADGDGNVNINDVTAIQRHVAESELLTGSSFFAADTDRNGVVDINDATLLQQYLAEFNVTLGAQSDTA